MNINYIIIYKIRFISNYYNKQISKKNVANLNIFHY